MKIMALKEDHQIISHLCLFSFSFFQFSTVTLFFIQKFTLYKARELPKVEGY